MGRRSELSARFDEEAIQRRRALTAFSLLVGVTLSGTFGFWLIEGWPVWKCFYFTLITITTVGYGDEGISNDGAKFATLLLMFGIAAASYAFSVLVQYTVNRESTWRKRMRNGIAKAENHVIVVGFGRMGESLCEELQATDYPFVVVEATPSRAQLALEKGHLVVQGAGSEDEVLLEAGVERATHLVTLTGAEGQNIVVALTARELSSDIQIIARAESQSDVRKLKRAGADKVVSPFQSGGVTVANMITHPKVAEFLSTSGTGRANVALAEVTIEDSSPIVGQSLRDFGRDVVPHVCFVALERDSQEPMIPPRGDEQFRPDDILIVAGDPDEVAKMKDSGRRLAPVSV